MRGFVWKGALCTAVLGLGAWATAQSTANALDTRIDFTVKDAELLQALEVLGKNTGLKFVIRPGTEEFKKVNLRLEDELASNVLQYVCQAASARAVRDENGVYIVYGPGAEPTRTVEKPTSTGRSIFRRLRVMNNRPEHILSMIGTGKPDYDESVPSGSIPSFQPANETSRGFQRPETAAAPSQLQRGGGGGFTGVSGGGGTFGGGAPGQGGGGVQGGGGSGAFGGLRGGQGLVPPGTDRILYDPTTNSLLFWGTDQALKDLYKLLAELDVSPQQVQVKFEFVTVTRSIHTGLGIDWTYERGGVFFGVSPGSFARAGDNVFFNWASGNVSSRLRTSLTGDAGNTVVAPMVRTLNNQTGSVTFTTTITVFNSTVTPSPGGNIINTTQTRIPVPTQIAVRPRINGNGTITMGVSPSIQTLGGIRRGPDGSEAPDIISQNATVVAIIKNGESIAVGGMTNKSTTGSYSSIPLLSELPIFGQLFRSRNKDVSANELVIFITPTIVSSDEAGLVSGAG